MTDQYLIVEDPEWANVHRQIDEDAAKASMTDCDVYVAWRLGMIAFNGAKVYGAKFPHDTDVPQPCCGKEAKQCDCDPKTQGRAV